MILIVDDDADLADTCAMLLKACGYQVAIAGNGVEALKKIDRCIPDLIVTDCQMPRMGGIELCAAVRQRAAALAVPIILMSGTEEYRCLNRANYNAFLKKPFLAEQLIVAIQALLTPVNARAGERWDSAARPCTESTSTEPFAGW